VSEPRPPCAHSLFEPRFESPTRRPKAPSGISQWDLRSSHSEGAAFRVGSRGLPSGKSRGAEWEVARRRVGSREAPSGKSSGREWRFEIENCFPYNIISSLQTRRTTRREQVARLFQDRGAGTSRPRLPTRRLATSHSAPRDFPLGASRLPTRRLATSHSEVRDFPLAWAFATAGHAAPALLDAIATTAAPRLREFNPQDLANTAWAFAAADLHRVGERLSAPRWRLARRGAGGPLAVSHSAARVGGSPLPCARHFLWGTFLRCPRLYYLI